MDRPLPRAVDAEAAVLGSILRNGEVLTDLAGQLEPRNFHEPHHAMIFRAMVGLWEDRKPIDLVTVGEALRAGNRIAAIGGWDFLAGLVERCPVAANAGYYANLVREAFIRRELHNVCTDVMQRLEPPTGTATDLLEHAESAIFGISEEGAGGQSVPWEETLSEVSDQIDAWASGDMHKVGLQTGFETLDHALLGLKPAELIVVGARPSVGKTAFACNLIRALLAQGEAVFFASLEQSRQELCLRLLSLESGCPLRYLQNGKFQERHQTEVLMGRKAMQDWRLSIDDRGGQSITRITANARRLKRRANIGLVVVDYLQLVEAEAENRFQVVSQVSRRLKALAKDLNVPVLALSQLNRSVESRTDQEPKLADLRESGQIEQDADAVILLHRPGPRTDPHDIQRFAIVAKNRNGPTGRCEFTWKPATMEFSTFIPGVNETPNAA